MLTLINKFKLIVPGCEMNTRITFILSAVFSLAVVTSADPAWEIMNPLPVAGDITALEFVDVESGFLCSDGGLMKSSPDGGATWYGIGYPHPELSIIHFDFASRLEGMLLSGSDRDDPWIQNIYTTLDAGDSWTTLRAGSPDFPAGLTRTCYHSESYMWAGGATIIDGVTNPVVFRLIDQDSLVGSILPDGEGITLKDIDFYNRNFGWAVGERGYIAYTENGGVSWTAVERITDFDLRSVSFYNPLSGWAVGGNFDNAVILFTDDGGLHWEVQARHPASTRLVSVSATGFQSAVTVSEGDNDNLSRVFRTSGAGNWTQVFEDENHNLACLSAIGNRIWVGGSDGYLVFTPNAHDWQTLSRNILPGSVHSISFHDDRHGWAGGSAGILLSTSNQGATWRRSGAVTQNTIINVYFQDADNGWLMAESSLEFRTIDGGRNWQAVDVGGSDVNLVEFAGSTGYATHGTSVAVASNNGDRWQSTQVIRGTGIPAIALSVPDPRTAYVASPGDSLRKTTDSGQTWTAENAPFTNCFGVDFIDPDHGWVLAAGVNSGTVIFSTENGGAQWHGLHRFEFNPGGVCFVDEDHGWVWGNPGFIFATRDGGRTWEDMQIQVNRVIRKIHAADENHLWACGDGGLIARWGEDWMGITLENQSRPAGFVLSPPVPNPFNAVTTVRFALPAPERVRLSVFDLRGREVAVLADRQFDTGHHRAEWNAAGHASGVYFCRIRAGEFVGVKKVMLMR